MALLVLVLAAGLGAEEKYALIIGNGDYQGLGKLKNPVNDAQDMAASLRKLGFEVTLSTNAGIDAMEQAVAAFGRTLGTHPQSTGLFFYAGHGVQSQGENYLIPVNGDIADENQLKRKALAVGYVLDTLNSSGNKLNLIFLDACRDNPFSWKRSASRGLSVVGTQPPGSVIVYATSAGSTAADGSGRNGLFTEQLLKYIGVPGLELSEMLRQAGQAVVQASNRSQTPAIYNQFFGTFYLNPAGATTTVAQAVPTAPISAPPAPATSGPRIGAIAVPVVVSATGNLKVRLGSAGTLSVAGQSVAIPAGGTLPIEGLPTGPLELVATYAGGQTELHRVEIMADTTTNLDFLWKPVTGAKAGRIATVAGTGAWTTTASGKAAAIGLKNPSSVSAGANGSLFICEANGKAIRLVDSQGNISVFAGALGVEGRPGNGVPALQTRFAYPFGITLDSHGNLWVADSNNCAISRIDPAGIATLVSGAGPSYRYLGDGGPALGASYFSPVGVAVDSKGTVYVADSGNHCVRRIDPDGTIGTAAGRGGISGMTRDTKPAAESLFNTVAGVAVDSADRLYFCDTGNAMIFRVNPDGGLSIVAGTGSAGYSGDGGPATKAKITRPRGLAFDVWGNLFFVDSGNYCIRKVDANGIISTVAGMPGIKGFDGDGQLARYATLIDPYGICFDAEGNLYIADSGANAVRKVSAGF